MAPTRLALMTAVAPPDCPMIRLPIVCAKVCYLNNLDLIIHFPALGKFLVAGERFAAFDQHFSGFGDHDRVGGNGFQDERHAADVAALADGDGSENGRADADGHIILDSGMAFLFATGSGSPPAGRAERDLVVEHHIVADDSCFADDHARAMVDEEAFADLRARVDLDAAGQEAGELRDQAWDEGDVRAIEFVGEAVEEHGPEALIEQGFEEVTASGIFLEDHVDGVGPDGSATW